MELSPRINIMPAILSFECYEAKNDPHMMLRDLTAVGKEKPLGYIPMASLYDHYKVDVLILRRLLEREGINTLVIASEHHRGESLFFAYDPDELTRVLQDNAEKLIAFGWTTQRDDFIQRLNRQWVEMAEDVYDVIALAFGAHCLLEAKCRAKGVQAT
jgi:hypothetical protein